MIGLRLLRVETVMEEVGAGTKRRRPWRKALQDFIYVKPAGK
jgi:hypothetical protein